jgi:hypothetical protein
MEVLTLMRVIQQHYDAKPETIVEVVGPSVADSALYGVPYLVVKIGKELATIPEYKMEKV